MRIYVGNMSYDTTEGMLRDLFGEHGEVEEVAVIEDRETGRPRGFAFVTMPDDTQGRAAIEAINGVEFEGRTLNVNEARPRGSGRREYGGDGGGGGGGGGGGDYQRERW